MEGIRSFLGSLNVGFFGVNASVNMDVKSRSRGDGRPFVAYEDVQVQFSHYVTALHGVSLTFGRGEFAFLVGKTGAGKSTLLKLLYREVRETQGRVLLDGRDLASVRSRDIPELRRGMGIVPQDFALLPRKRIWENVAYAMRAVGASRKEVRRRVPEILDLVQIGHRADAFPHELSGGEQQRVAIARALINDPPLLLADEPTGNLDPEHSWGIMELLLKVNARGTTVLVASHDMLTIERMGMRVVKLEAGNVASDSAEIATSLPSEDVDSEVTVVEPEIDPARALIGDLEEAETEAFLESRRTIKEPADA